MTKTSTEEYKPLRRDSIERWSDDTGDTLSLPQKPKRWAWPTSKKAIFGMLLVSIAINLCFTWMLFSDDAPEAGKCVSDHAGLKRTVPMQIFHSTEYTGDNVTAVADLWEELSGDPGVVALSEDYVSEKRLPHALRFPWDQTKGVFLLQGFHNLHCLRTLFRYVKYTELGQPQHIAASHALHCLDQLRQDVICNADDTPRYAGFQDPPGTGSGQVRMCKDWSKLEEWALERTACFSHEDEVPGPMVDRFKSCPDGRVLWATDLPSPTVT